MMQITVFVFPFVSDHTTKLFAHSILFSAIFDDCRFIAHLNHFPFGFTEEEAEEATEEAKEEARFKAAIAALSEEG